MNKLTPFLWFNDNAQDAAAFYLSIFPSAKQTGGLAPGGKVLTVALEIEGQQMTFLNGGSAHQLSEAFSFVISCKDQAEIDRYWTAFSDGGAELNCGWIKDKFGLCWQVVPEKIFELLKHPAAMQAMMKMKKFDIATLEAAAETPPAE